MSKIKLIKYRTLKTFKFRPSGRSSDYIAPPFIKGCLANCTYCYEKRYVPKGIWITENSQDILTAINNHALFDTIEKPNQTDPEFITYDISCNEDFVLHEKYHDWVKIFEFFRDHSRAKATLATKFVPPDNWLDFNPNQKVRIRFSLMPVFLSQILEPKTSDITRRIMAINRFCKAGYDVHVNFSPVVVFEGWLEYYKDLFSLLNFYVKDEYKHRVKAEVIFLTHNELKHEYNLEHSFPGENYLWHPDFQELKKSQNSGTNLRYKKALKNMYIQEFTYLHSQMIPWNTIRYIF